MTDNTGSFDGASAAHAADELSIDALRTVVELQRTELSRLLREQSRLNDRIDTLLRLQEREQVLRQQMQASLDRLADAQVAMPDNRSALLAAESRTPQQDDMSALERRLERTEGRFSELQHAVGNLVAFIERSDTVATPTKSGDYVRIYAPD